MKALPSDDDDNLYLYGLARKKDECKRCEDEIASLHLSPLAGVDSLLERGSYHRFPHGFAQLLNAPAILS